MRTNEERLEAMHKRTSELRAERKRRRSYISSVAGAVASVVFIIALSIYMPSIAQNITASADTGMRGSIFANSDILGYVVIGLVAFLLGISFTIFCFRLKKWSDDEKKIKREHSDDRNDR